MATIMSERDVVAKANALNKAVTAREPTPNILNLMRDLQKGVKPSEELLRKTGIGKIINRLKAQQGVDPQIPRMASEIVSQWRNQIQRAKSSGAATPTRPSDGQNGSASPAPTPKSEAKTESKENSKPTGVPLDKRTWKADKLNKASFHSESGRANSIGLMYDGLVPGSSLPPAKVLDIARDIESAIISQKEAENSHTSSFYKEKIRSLYQNLKNPQNPALRKNILSEDITPSRFAVMTHDEMKSDVQKKEEEKIQKKNLSDAMVPQEEKSVSSHLECGRCKQKKVSFTQAQTRSADEPMTTFCECMVCGNSKSSTSSMQRSCHANRGRMEIQLEIAQILSALGRVRKGPFSIQANINVLVQASSRHFMLHPQQFTPQCP